MNLLFLNYFVFIFFVLIPVKTAFAGAILLHSSVASTDKIISTMSVYGTKASQPNLFQLGSSSGLHSTIHKQSLDLWLLLDSSALCLKNKADQQLASWVEKLKKELPPESRVSLILFHRGALTVIGTQLAIEEVPVHKLRCQSSAVSSEPDKAIAYVLETEKPQGLVRAIWILSSGNVAVASNQLSELRASRTELAFFIYNPIVYKAINPLFESMRSILGESLFYSGTVGVEQTDLPAHSYRIQSALPPGKNPSPFSIVAEAKEGEVTLKSPVISVTIPSKTNPSPFHKVLFLLFITGLGTVLGAIIYYLFRYFRPRICPACKKRMRFSDKQCPFCFANSGAYLVCDGKGLCNPPPFSLVTPLLKNSSPIGTHRKSVIRLLRNPKEKRRIFFQIDRKGESYCLLPKNETVFVNQYPVDRMRFLASGDMIGVDQFEIKFIKMDRRQNV